MAAANNSNNQLEYPCTHCGAMFKRRPGGRATCTSACAKAAERQQKTPKLKAKEKKIAYRKQRLLECAFGFWLLDQARRAGTVQTFKGINSAGLHLLYQLHVYRKKRYGWVEGGHGKDLFQLCHVQPLKGRDGSIGLTIPENLFAGIARLNQQQSNKPVSHWAGASIPATARKRKWNITDDMTRDQVLQKLAAFLGPELDIFLDELEEIPHRTMRLCLARKVFKHQDDELYQPLNRRYTLAELEALGLDALQALDATQQWRTNIKGIDYSNCPTDSELGVLYDELARFSDLLPDGHHRNNCKEMLKLVRLLGIYLVQINDKQGTARSRFLKTGSATWSPLLYLHHDRPWRAPAQMLADDLETLINGVYDPKGRELKPGIIATAQMALQGLEIDLDHIRNRVMKRVVVQSLVPMVTAPDEWSWKASGSNWLSYIDKLYATFEPTWQALLDAGMCTEKQVLDAQDAMLVNLDKAVCSARQRYRDRPCQWSNIAFKRFPQWLQFSPVELPQAA
jgi:hypothetical protein